MTILKQRHSLPFYIVVLSMMFLSVCIQANTHLNKKQTDTPWYQIDLLIFSKNVDSVIAQEARLGSRSFNSILDFPKRKAIHLIPMKNTPPTDANSNEAIPPYHLLSESLYDYYCEKYKVDINNDIDNEDD